jgi:hypothetical protein
MTTTESDFEQRLRRDLAELGGLPAIVTRERAAVRPARPVTTVSIALAVVLVLVAASFAIVRADEHERTPAGPAPRPRPQTILEQPRALTGSTTSIATTEFPQVCEKWRELPAGIDCRDLQARFVWEPGVTKRPYSFFVIEVVGPPDLKLLTAAANPRHPVYETVTVRGRRARLFGDANALILTWQQLPALQVYVQVSIDPSAARHPESLRNMIVDFANAMRPLAIDPAGIAYVLRSGTVPLEYPLPHGVQAGRWELTWRPRDRRLCTNESVVEVSDCITNVARGGKTLRAANATTIRLCPQPWVGKDRLVFGAAPARAERIAISYRPDGGDSTRHLVTPLVAPPGEPSIRVFAAALDHPRRVSITAQDHNGTAIAHQDLPVFEYTCQP